MTLESHLGTDPIFKKFKETLQKATSVFDETGIKIDALQCELAAMEKAPPIRSPGDQATAAAALENARTLHRTESVMAAEAARGATRITTQPLQDGWLEVSIDGRIAKLPPMLGMLFTALVADIAPSDDEFIAWKSVEQLKKMVSKCSGKPMSTHTLTNLVSRLRKKLRTQANLHRRFIQRSPHRGMRFALRRQELPDGERMNPLARNREFLP